MGVTSASVGVFLGKEKKEIGDKREREKERDV